MGEQTLSTAGIVLTSVSPLRMYQAYI